MWEGSAESEVGREADTGIVRVRVNPKFYRPAEVEFLQGDCSKAKSLFEWKPKYDFKVGAGLQVESADFAKKVVYGRWLLTMAGDLKPHGNPLNSSHFDAPNTKFAPTGYRRSPNHFTAL